MPRIVTSDFTVGGHSNAWRDSAFTISSVALRLYLAFIWLRFGIAKLAGGWLRTNPLRPLLTAVAGGQIPTTAPGYAWIARAIVGTHMDTVLSIAIPCTELAIAIALLTGLRLCTAALIACALNLNLLLAGVGSVALDGRMLVLQALLVAHATLVPSPVRRIFPGWKK